MRCPARRNSSRSISPNGGPTAPAPSDAMSNLRDASARLGAECFLDRIAHREYEGIRGGAIMRASATCHPPTQTHATWHLDEANLKISNEGFSPSGLRHGAPFPRSALRLDGATYLRDETSTRWSCPAGQLISTGGCPRGGGSGPAPP